jgi:phosphonopyruvate decarboxylase
MMKRDACIAKLLRHRTDQIIVAAYHAAFDLLRLQPSPLNFVAIGAMGLASSHALGLALGRPDRRFVVLDGDGSLLMNLGTLVTIGEAAPPNLLHFVCENGTYEANGGVPIPGRERVDFAAFARAAGYRESHEFSDLDDFAVRVPALLSARGPVFTTLKIEPGEPSKKDYEYIHGPEARAAFKKALTPPGPRSP